MTSRTLSGESSIASASLDVMARIIESLPSSSTNFAPSDAMKSAGLMGSFSPFAADVKAVVAKPTPLANATFGKFLALFLILEISLLTLTSMPVNNPLYMIKDLIL